MAQAASKTCEVCVSASGSHYCIDCEEYYCENCKFVHNKQKLSRNHQFQKASDRIPKDMHTLCDRKTQWHTFSQIVDVIVQLRGDNETKLRSKINEANRKIQKIEESLNVFDNSVESVIKAISDEGNKIKRMVDKSVAQMIALVKEQSKKKKTN
ncbi:Hypothetical predicted protein [Mytilus galloprovincialis]|uniref:B box-type domain-containing protein n=1 Tax=Mytilus galloprovincialis TaxID=29158 RepID=A0A8B6CSL7_MYTGA|nr:Hypothetical predicted protein [Mytilus galloprovincialis]